MSMNLTWEDGRVSWRTDGLDGRAALWLLCDVLCDLYRYHFKSDIRPIFPADNARVCIELLDERLAIAFRPEAELGTAKALTAAALVALCETGSGPEVNPFRVMFGAIVRDTHPQDGGLSIKEIELQEAG